MRASIGLVLLAACSTHRIPGDHQMSATRLAEVTASDPRTEFAATGDPVGDQLPEGALVSRLPDGRGCLDPGRLSSVQAQVEQHNARALEEALATRGLEPVTLQAREEVLGRGATPPPNVRPFGSIVVVHGERYIAGGVHWDLGASKPAPPEFVQDSAGRIFRLRAHAQVRTSIELHLCACPPPPRCGPYGSGCRACGRTVQVLHGPLPPDGTYAGDIELRYPTTQLSVFYDERDCPPPNPCPPPPP